MDGKNKYDVGDLIIYCEIDSFLPIRPEFEFLRKTSYKKMGEIEGFRLKTIRLRGELSQGLLIDPSVLATPFIEGDDVTEELGIVKYDPPLPANLSGIAKGIFPGYIPKTDEERVQNLDYQMLAKHSYLVTEKLDGSSMTVFFNKGEIGVCSRNLELLESEGNSLWQMISKYDLKKQLKYLNRNIAIQGEIIGYGIQKNHYKLNEVDIRVFKVWDIDNGTYLSISELIPFIHNLGMTTVPIIEQGYQLPPTIDDLMSYTNDISRLYQGTRREGLVFFSEQDSRVHFKVISNEFLIKGANK